MVDPRWRKILRDIWLHKARTLLVTAAIALGVAGAGSVLDTWSIVRKVTRDQYLASRPAAATLKVDSIDAVLLDRVRAIPEVSAAAARRTITASVRTNAGDNTAMLFALADFSRHEIGAVSVDSGPWPPADGTVVVERSSIDFAETSMGDAALVRLGENAPVRLGVSGIAHDVGLAPGWMDHLVYGFVSPGTLKQMGAPSTFNELQLRFRNESLNRDEVRRAAYAVKAVVEAAGHSVSDVVVPEPGRHIHAAQMDSLLFTQGAFGVLALLLSAFLVVNLITAMLAGQVREIGIMKTVGASVGQLAAMYLSLAFALGLVASAVAVPAAALIGRGYARFSADLLNFSVDGVAIPRMAIVLQIAVGGLLPVLAAAFPVWRGCRIAVGDALRDVGISATAADERAGRWLRSVGGLSRPVLLSLRNSVRRRQRMILTLITLATGGAVYLGARSLRQSVIGSVDLLYQPQRFEMTLRLVQEAKADVLEKAVASIDGVAGVEAWTGARAMIPRSDGTFGEAFAVTAPPARTRLFTPTLAAGRWLSNSGAHELVVSRRLLQEEPTLTVGSDVAVVVAGRTMPWRIVGLVDGGPQATAYADRDVIVALAGLAGPRSVVVASRDTSAAGQLALMQRLRAELPSHGVDVLQGSLLSAGRVALEDHLVMIVGFLGIMGKLMIIVGGLGLGATMSVSVLERTREIGILRAMGAPHSSIHLLVHAEGLAFAVASWLLAIPLSIPMNAILGRAFARVMFSVPDKVIPESGGIVIWLGVVLAVSLVACAWPAWRATRVSPSRALSYE